MSLSPAAMHAIVISSSSNVRAQLKFGVDLTATSDAAHPLLPAACPPGTLCSWMAERQEQHTGAHQRAEQPQAPRAHQGLRSALQHVRKSVQAVLLLTMPLNSNFARACDVCFALSLRVCFDETSESKINRVFV